MSGASSYFPGKWKSQTFTSSGTFNVPDNVDTVFVEMYGGGGGGTANSPITGTGAAGGRGAKPVSAFVPVTPGGNVTVTIGSGGAPGSPGGDTSFGSIFARGAPAGQAAVQGGATFRAASGPRGIGGINNDSTGGEGGYGNGGNGYDASPVTFPTNGGIGAGGGGGGGGPSPNPPIDGGSGGPGLCIVWYKAY